MLGWWGSVCRGLGGFCVIPFLFLTFFSVFASADCETDGYLSSSGFVDLPDVPPSLPSPVAALEPSFTSMSPRALSGAHEEKTSGHLERGLVEQALQPPFFSAPQSIAVSLQPASTSDFSSPLDR